MLLITSEMLTCELCRKYEHWFFVFGDNLIRKGRAGQAVIRNEPNGFGVPTKRLPSMRPKSFFTDREDEVSAVQEAINEIISMVNDGVTIVLPKNKIGSGLARLKSNSPIIANMVDELYEMAEEWSEEEHEYGIDL